MIESIPVADLTLAQLIQMSQGLGHQLEKIREQRAYLKERISERLAAGESEHVIPVPDSSDGSASAPGADITVQSVS
jgi:hypothetical protein